MTDQISSPASLVSPLNDCLSASFSNYTACVDVVAHQEQIDGISVVTRMHHLKFNGNGLPMVEELANCLMEHIVHYCLAARNRPHPRTLQQATRYVQEARKLFRQVATRSDDPDRTGEAGEMLLYFLIESVLQAPQVVAKMDLKTNPALEVNGSDGIHMKWNQSDQVLDVYFGEAKLYQDAGAAMTAALNSIEGFHATDMRRHEFSMATNHFKHVQEEVRLGIKDILHGGVPGPTARINHACLIGYDWAEFNNLPQGAVLQLESEFRTRYVADAQRLHGLLQSRFNLFQRRQLRFQVFFLPFKSVQEFRDAFNRVLA